MQTIAVEERRYSAVLYLIGLWLLATMALWGFAFYHTSGATPEWLRRAQSACFGTDESGLPDTYGWTVLIIAPLSMLLAVITTFKNEICHELSCLLESRRWKILIAGFAMLFALESLWIGDRIKTGLAILNTTYDSLDSGKLPLTYPRTSKPAPQFDLVDQNSKSVSTSSLQGKTVVVSFFFAHCHTVCPVIIKTLQQASLQLPKEQVSSLARHTRRIAELEQSMELSRRLSYSLRKRRKRRASD